MARYETLRVCELMLVEEDTGQEVMLFAKAGAPTSGTTGTKARRAPTGSLCVDLTNAATYQNTNTQASPLWTLVGIQST